MPNHFLNHGISESVTAPLAWRSYMIVPSYACAIVETCKLLYVAYYLWVLFLYIGFGMAWGECRKTSPKTKHLRHMRRAVLKCKWETRKGIDFCDKFLSMCLRFHYFFTWSYLYKKVRNICRTWKINSHKSKNNLKVMVYCDRKKTGYLKCCVPIRKGYFSKHGCHFHCYTVQ